MILHLEGTNRFVLGEKFLKNAEWTPTDITEHALYQAEKAKSPITVKLGDTQVVVSPNQHYGSLRFKIAQAVKPFRLVKKRATE